MKRRKFLKTMGASGLAVFLTPGGIVHAFTPTSGLNLEDGFKAPPASAKPQTFFHFMNGNITTDGITRDFEAMSRVGIGGLMSFDGGIATPKGNIKYGSKEWNDLLRYAIKEADRLGLEYSMHNCPGWSSSGGPWNTPEHSMQEVVWTERFASGGQRLKVQLPKPFTRQGYYRDTYVVAFRSVSDELHKWDRHLIRLSNHSGEIDTAQLDNKQGIELIPTADGQQAHLLMEFSKPMKSRSVIVYGLNISPGVEISYGVPATAIEVSDDGVNFRELLSLRGNKDPQGGSYPEVEAKFYRLSVQRATRIYDVNFSSTDKLPGWLVKANFNVRSSDSRMNEQAPYVGKHPRGVKQYKESIPHLVSEKSIIDSATIVDVTRHMNAEGYLDWEAPEGNWTILRMGHTTNGVVNRAAPDGGAGLEVDKFSAQAFDKHFEGMFGQLLPALRGLGKKGRVGVLLDSYEVGPQNWSRDFPSEFEKRCGYSLANYIPAMTGRVIGSQELTERFLWDLRRVQSDLIVENYYGRCAERCKENGFYFAAEPYKLGPFDGMHAGSTLDVALGEFWARGQRNRHTVKMAASIQHINGKKLVAAEAYTGHAIYSKWQQYPFSLKAQGDFMFTKGLTRMVFHTYAHQPHPNAKPGMTMGPFGTHIDRNVTWFEPGAAWFKYLSRTQFMLQQGLFVADLLYFKGDEAPGVELALRDTLTPALPVGYDYDDIDFNALLSRVRIEAGRIVLPDGMSYRLLVLPVAQAMSLKLLQKLRDLISQGMVVVGPKPTVISGLIGREAGDDQFTSIADQVWGNPDVLSIGPRTFGLGKVYQEGDLASVMNDIGVSPDFSYTSRLSDPAINYIHRRMGDTEVYFIANRKRRKEDLLCRFRVSGHQPEIWDAATGKRALVPIYEMGDANTQIPLHLEPAGSIFVVFRKVSTPNNALNPVQSIEKDGQPLLGFEQHNTLSGRHQKLSNTFSMEAWVKPESDIAMSGINVMRREDVSGHVFFPSIGEEIYGKGHAICGATLGLNGVVVYERNDFRINPVLEVVATISGKTHFALVYKNGVPHVYLNGVLMGQGQASAYTVHPCLDEEYQDAGSAYFEGDRIGARLHDRALEAAELVVMAKSKPTLIEDQSPVEFSQRQDASLLFYENGNYRLIRKSGLAERVVISDLKKPLALDGAWKIDFPPGLGAPATVTLPKLESLHLHTTDGVRYFSGTSVYRKDFVVPAGYLSTGRRQFLNLGQVEVMAEVIVNGSNLGVLWKRPFVVDVTEALVTGKNKLEIRVTNLWPNRLIGDEQLPSENEYYDTPFEGQQGGGIKALPEWYTQGRAKPESPRVTFTTWKHYHRDSPLLESGLIGPVLIQNALERQV